MSAVMSTLSMISGGRRAHRKLASSSGRKSGQLSDAGEDRRARREPDLGAQRSASLQTLETSGVVNLESLEAKMASIEVSLGRRRSGAGARELDALRAALTDKDALIHSLKKQLSASLSAARLAAGSPPPGAGAGAAGALAPDERRALDERAAAVRADLDARRANIQELRRRIEKTHVTENIDTRIQQAELQYKLGREELELLTLGEQARALAQLIAHADAAARRDLSYYSTVRECGGSATLVAAEAREGAWGAAARGAGLVLDWARDNPALRAGDRIVEVNGAPMLSCRSVEELARAAGAGAARLVLLRAPAAPSPPGSFTQTEAASLRAELGALRAAGEGARRANDGLRADNTRLTHRISYLEDQVAELLARHPQLHSVSSSDSCITVNKTKKNVTNISISSEPPGTSPRSEVQVFQKGPDITALVAKLPGLDADAALPLLRPRSGASGASSRAAASPRASPAPAPAPRDARDPREPRARMRHSLSHHCIHAADYSAETDAAIRMIERNQRHMEKQRLKADKRLSLGDERQRADGDAAPPCEIKKAAERIEESIKKTNWAERKTLSIIEQLKRSQRLRKLKKNDSAEDVRAEPERPALYHRIDGKVLENAHKSSRRTARHSRSAKSSEFESESDYPNGDAYCGSPRADYGSDACSTRLGHYRKHEERREGEERARPTPPRKPLRLSLHKARSAHSLLHGDEEPPSRPGSEAGEGKRPVKRTHAREGRDGRDGREGRETRATPRPARRGAGSLSACGAPAADALYPPHAAARWC